MKLAQSNIGSFDLMFVNVYIVLQLNVSSLAMIITPFALLMVDLLVVVVVLCVCKPPVCANALTTHLLFAAFSLVGVTSHKENISSYSCI
jgi:FtsH-binding integral membrane protein